MVELTGVINLSNYFGKNSYSNEHGELFIKNIVAFAPGKYRNDKGIYVDIGLEYIKNTNWQNLLVGRPVISKEHIKVDSSSYSYLAEGVVQAVRVNSKVIVDLIIYNNSLKGKILSGELRSVSLSFVSDSQTKKIDYINHLAVVSLGQVPEAVINLKKEHSMTPEEKNEFDDLKEMNFNLKKEIDDLKKSKDQVELKAQIEAAKAEASKEAEENFNLKLAELKAEIEEETRLTTDLNKLNLSVDGTLEEKKKRISEFMLSKVKEFNPDYTPPDDNSLKAAFVMALAAEERKKTEVSNINLSAGGQEGKRVPGLALQEKAEKQKV